jgi:hypothetical protein
MLWARASLRLGVCLALAAALLPSRASAQETVKLQDVAIAAHARELIEGIEARRGSFVDKAYAYIHGQMPRVAVWPFRKDRIPIAPDVAAQMSDALLEELLGQSGSRFQFVARDALKHIITDMQETGALNDKSDPIAALMKGARSIDILIEGKMKLEERKLALYFKAIRVDGTIMAVSKKRRILLSRRDTSSTRPSLNLGQAIEAAAKYFADRAPELEEVHLGGIRYQDTGYQSQFARYVEQKVGDAMARHFENVLTKRRLKVKRLDAATARSRGLRGVGVEKRPIDGGPPSKVPGVMLLDGTYWLFADAIDLRLVLRDTHGTSVPWSARIRRDVGLELRPPRDVSGLRENDGLGPTTFELSSDRGDDPAYEIGQKLNLVMKVDRDAWVYCFYSQADGKVVQIFPNPHFWKHFDSPKLAGDQVHTVPGDRTFPFDLKLTKPVGQELVKCFAAGRDVTAELPKSLQGRSLDPLVDDLVTDLSIIFRRLPDAKISEASIAITVKE